MNLYAYLTFNGNCREAMTFYQKCIGGKLMFQTVGESPLSEKMPVRMKKCILQSTLHNDKFYLMGSDLVPDKGLFKGNGVSLLLHCSSEYEIRMLYKNLSLGGVQTHIPEVNEWGCLYGGLTDRFGIHWLLQYPKP